MKKLFILIFLSITVALSATTIYDIQYTTDAGVDGTYPSPLANQDVTVQGVVTAINAAPFQGNSRFFISQPEGGAWKGIYVFDWSVDVQLGDLVEVTGTVDEYYGYTELSYCDVTILSSGTTVPNPSIITTGQMVSGMTAESYEGCLVKVMNVTVTQAADNYGQWAVDDNTGVCFVDDFFSVNPEPVVGNVYSSIIGTVNYFFDAFSINPRTMADVVGGSDTPHVSVTGQIISNASEDGIVGSVSLIGAQNYSTSSNSEGYFTIENVLGNEDYTVTIIAQGYESSTFQISTDEENYDIGVIMLSLIAIPPISVVAEIQNNSVEVSWQDHREQIVGSYDERVLPDGYKVWRLISGSENNQDSWTLLTSQMITTNSYTDTNWIGIAPGFYKYAVKSIYPGNNISLPVFSNELNTGLFGTIEGNVLNSEGNSISNSQILIDLEPIDTDANGYFLLNNVLADRYSISATANNYKAESVIIDVVSDEITSVVFHLEDDNSLFSDNFEGQADFVSPEYWVNVDGDLSPTVELQGYNFANSTGPKSFIVFTPTMTIPPLNSQEFTPWSGNKYLTSFAAINSPNNDWLISQEMELDNYGQISFYAKSATDQFELDRFSVLVSDGSMPLS